MNIKMRWQCWIFACGEIISIYTVHLVLTSFCSQYLSNDHCLWVLPSNWHFVYQIKNKIQRSFKVIYQKFISHRNFFSLFCMIQEQISRNEIPPKEPFCMHKYILLFSVNPLNRLTRKSLKTMSFLYTLVYGQMMHMTNLWIQNE